jgi:hypothetical protein
MPDTPLTLPDHPSPEHLRKQAKRLARETGLGLAQSQRRLAADYGFADWAALLRQVAATRGEAASPLAAAAAAADIEAVRGLLGAGAPVDGAPGEIGTPLWRVCASDAPAAGRLATARLLIAAGADLRRDEAGSTPLHEAAARGPLELVEALIAAGSIGWLADRKHRSVLERARTGHAPDRSALIELLDRPVIRDPKFRAAVRALQSGDLRKLSALLDAEPRLLRERIIEPDCYRAAPRGDYFRDPALIWFVANNPTLIKQMPANIEAITQAMIDRGVKPADLDYALELVITSAPAREQGHQLPLLAVLTRAGAKASPAATDGALAHRELAPVRALVAAGAPVTLEIASGLGLDAEVAHALPGSTPTGRQMALAHAAINGHAEAARLILDAGADLNANTPVHSHATPLHHAALYDHVEVVRLLLARGANPQARDTLWDGTPLDWTIHGGETAPSTRALLEALGRP